MITAKQASRENKELKSYWSVETQLNQRILIAILWHLESPTNKLRHQIAGLRGYIKRLKSIKKKRKK